MYTVVTRPYATFIVLFKTCFKTFLRKYYIDGLKVCQHFFKLDFESLASCFCVLFQAVYNIELI